MSCYQTTVSSCLIRATEEYFDKEELHTKVTNTIMTDYAVDFGLLEHNKPQNHN